MIGVADSGGIDATDRFGDVIDGAVSHRNVGSSWLSGERDGEASTSTDWPESVNKVSFESAIDDVCSGDTFVDSPGM
jgi:hypothetical protein